MAITEKGGDYDEVLIAHKSRSINQARFLIDGSITFFEFRFLSSPISQMLSDIAVDMSGRMAEDALMHANIQNTK